jgi:hypothetical protein
MAMSNQEAVKEFFDRLEEDKDLQDKIRLGLETLVKIAAGYNVTEDDLNTELRRRWECGVTKGPTYSEPPGL